MQQLEIMCGGACPRNCAVIKQSTTADWAPNDRIFQALPDRTALVQGPQIEARMGALRLRATGPSGTDPRLLAHELRPLTP